MRSDLRKEFPDMKGFSAENLKHIRCWYIFYNDYLIGLQAVTQLLFTLFLRTHVRNFLQIGL